MTKSPRLPPTEQLHPRARTLHRLPPAERVRLLVSEERRAFAAVHGVAEQIAALGTQLAQTWVTGGTLFYVGAGTSGRLGALDGSEVPPTFGIPPRQAQALLAGGKRAMWHAVEGAEDDSRAGAQTLARRNVGQRDLVVGIAASGNTPYVIGALKYAAKLGVPTALIACAQPKKGNIPKSTRVILLKTGPELVLGSTRMTAGTATKLALNALSTEAAVQLGRVFEGHMVALRPTNKKLRQRAVRTTSDLTGLVGSEAKKLLSKGRLPGVAAAMHRTGVSKSVAEQALKAGKLGILLGAKHRSGAR